MKGIYFNGRRVLRPQAISKIDDSGMYGRGLGGGNTLALIGECTGGEPGKVLWFTDPANAKAILRSGELLTALQRAFDPSTFAGAYLVGVVRVNPALQSSLTLKDINGIDTIDLTSVDYGIWNNQIRVRLEAGTTYGTAYDVTHSTYLGSKKVTITYGTSEEQGDDIYRKSFAFGLADPDATAGTFTISKATGLLTTTVVATPNKVYLDAVAKTSPYGTILSAVEANALYIGSTIPFKTIPFTFTAPNTANCLAVNVKYWNGNAWTSCNALSGFSDGTISGGNSFAQSGTITLATTVPTDWQHSATATAAPAFDLYWIRITNPHAATPMNAATWTSTGLTRSGLNVTLASYPYIQDLVDYLDAQAGYEAYVLTGAPASELSTQLDDVTGRNFLTLATTYTSIDSTKTQITVGSTTNFSVNDYIVISQKAPTTYPGQELRKITQIQSGVLYVDSALALTYQASDPVRKLPTAFSNLQAVIDWFTDNSAYVEAAYHTGATTRGALANIADTYMSGGSEGTTTQSNWDTALELLQAEDTPLICTVSYDPSVWASLSTHVDYMSSLGKKERRGFVGGFATADSYTSGLGKWTTSSLITASVNQMKIYAEQLNSDRMYYVGPGFIAYDENGNKTTYAGHISAAAVAGLAAGVDVAEPLTHKNIKALGLEYDLKWGDLDTLLDGGVFPLEYDAGFGYRVCQSISTWLQSDNYYRRELSVGRVGDYVARQVRDRLERDFVGRKGTSTTLLSIKNATISVLETMYRLELLAGDDDNPPYKNIQVNLIADTCNVEFECSPVIPINYIPITIHLTVYTATLTA